MLRLVLNFLLLALSTSSFANGIEGIRLSQNGAETRLVFDLNDTTQHSVFTLDNPDRLVIDLKNTEKNSRLTLPNFTDTPITHLRFGVRNKTGLRVVLDLNKKVTHSSQTLAKSSTAPFRLVIDLHDTAYKAPITVQPPLTAPATPEKIVQPENKPELPPQHTAEPQPIIKVTKPTARRNIIIAIDAGHGGKDSGALGRKGTKEKDVVLAISRRLAKLVNNEPGMKAYLTRNSDVFLSLRQRINRARNQKADMFISIHADAFDNPRARGASVFVLSERGASSEAAKLLAQKENAADLVGGISLEDKDDLLASVLLDLSQTASLEASLEVAETVLSGLKRVGNVHKKHVESAAFVVLKSPDIPSILVETAFISNPDEERKLLSSSHQNKLARAILSGIKNYFQRNPLPGTEGPQQHIVSRGDTLSTIAERYRVSLNQLKTNNNLTSNNLKIGEILLIP